ncbi:hypothetical protein AGOR_G00251130 [Albula goreensis]|uniref:Tectonic-1 n=1 Tax=Albula goreensis TaxID=1534307 RepID=A0A8T3CHF9_9TELE|nr:hypothetical protein AGOR_G00251130 [Albula goreensis]
MRIPGSGPLPLSGSLPPPVTDVSSLCPCNLLEGRCDVNCCCDLDCAGDFKLFTQCSVEKLVADPQLCNQDTARYSLTTTADGSAKVQSSVTQEVNPDVFCIQKANYEAGLSFAPPEVPTEGNFNALFQRFAGFFFSDPTSDSEFSSANEDLQNETGYTFAEVMQTQEATGERGFFRLPAPSGSSQCSDANPAAFLQDQTTRCTRSFVLERDCEVMPSLNLQTYTSFEILSEKTENSTLVGVDLTSIVLQSLEGTRSVQDPMDESQSGPALLGTGPGAVCNNVVLQVSYLVMYDETGAVVGAAASAVLGAVDESLLPIQQEFTIMFRQQENATVGELPSSGNPGYVVGLPLVAGRRTAEYPFSGDRNGGLTLLQNPRAEQSCLGVAGLRAPVRFGVNTISGCTLRLEEVTNCSLVSELILGVLQGTDSPQFVASFGNSPPHAIMDWVPIKNITTETTAGAESCSIPLSLDVEVTWTKYGSLVNPQAQIVSVSEVIKTNTSSLTSLSGGSDVLFISTSVTFTDVSAAAQPGYRAMPTIDAKLPYDFFFPFV